MKMKGGAGWARSLEGSAVIFECIDKKGNYHPIRKKRRKATAPFTDSTSLGSDSTKNLNASNIVDFEYAEMPLGVNKLHLSAEIDFLTRWKKLDRATDHEIRRVIEDFPFLFLKKFGFKEIVKRYVVNMINPIWGWRNYLSARGAIETSFYFNEKIHTFNLGSSKKFFSLEDLNNNKTYAGYVNNMINFIEDSLIDDESEFPRMYISATFDIGQGRQVYPSERISLNLGEKRKELYSIADCYGNETVCFTREKFLNAIHRIDNWFSDDRNADPININAAGYDQGYSICHRTRSQNNDFYSILEKIETIFSGMKRSKTPSNDALYLMALIFHGHVFTE